MSKIGYNQGNNPFKKLGTHPAPVNKKNTVAKPKTRGRELYPPEPNAFQKYIDLDGDGKDEWWEYGLEAASWVPTAFAVGVTSPSGPGAVAAGAATKVGVKQLLKKGIQLGTKWFAGSKTKKAATIGGTGYFKAGQAGDVKKESEMQGSGYENTSDIPPEENATNIFDK